MFDVPQNDLTTVLKKTEMRAAAKIWREFKSELANKYIFGPKEGEDPRQMYPFIDTNQWKSFVEQRLTPEALQLRELNIARAKSNPYQHTMSRGGYKKAKADIVAAKLAEMEAQGLISPGDDPVIDVGRHEVWKRGHQRTNKEYVNDHMREVADKIDELEKQVRDGTFICHGRRDILTAAIGKDEYPGRTRGVGSLVGWKKVFGKQSSSSTTQSTVTSQALTIHSPQIGSDDDPFEDIPKVGKKCLLHVEGGGSDQGRRLVALGRVMRGRFVQCQELPDEMVKVVVEIKLEPSAELPMKLGLKEKVSDALGDFVGWPKCLVDIDEKVADE